MKQNRWIALVLVGGLSVASCGKSDEAKTESESTEQTATSSTNNESNVSTASVETANKPSRANATPASTLKTFIPSISGFTAQGDVETVQTKMGEYEYSVATQRFKNGEKSIEITIADYNNVAGLTAAYSMMMNMSVETNTEVTKGEKINGRPAWINYHKDNSSSQIGLMANDYVWIILQGDNGTSIDELRSAVNAMDLSKLSSIQ